MTATGRTSRSARAGAVLISLGALLFANATQRNLTYAV